MKKESFFELLGDIDEKYILEANEEDPAETAEGAEAGDPEAENKASRGATITPVPVKRKNEGRKVFLSVAAAAAAILLLIGGLWYAEVYQKKNDNHKLRGLTEHNTAVLEITTAAGGELTWATTRPETMAPTEADMTTTAGEETINEASIVTVEDTTAATYVIPAIPSGLGITAIGEPITDEDAAAYFSEQFNLIKRDLTSCEVPTDDLHISEKGYCHVSYEEMNSDTLTLDQSIRTYPVYNKNVLVAFITLTRQPFTGTNEITHNLGYDGPWYTDFDAFLKAHKGEELLFLYVNGYFEIVITPDGTLRNPQGESASILELYFRSIENPYEYIYCKEATYTP